MSRGTKYEKFSSLNADELHEVEAALEGTSLDPEINPLAVEEAALFIALHAKGRGISPRAPTIGAELTALTHLRDSVLSEDNVVGSRLVPRESVTLQEWRAERNGKDSTAGRVDAILRLADHITPPEGVDRSARPPRMPRLRGGRRVKGREARIALEREKKKNEGQDTKN